MASLVVPTLASAATADFRVLFDIDNNAATGCTEGGAHGVEQILVTRINTTDTSAQITRTYRQVCTNGVFGAPVDLDLTARPVGFTAPSGLLLGETRIAFSALTNAAMLPSLHLTFDASDGFSTQSVLTLPNGNAIRYPVIGDRRHSANSSNQPRHMVLDGQGGDWNALDPLVGGIANDGTKAVRILKIYAFANTGDNFLYFRFDGFIDNSNPYAQDDNYARKPGQGLSVPTPGVLANDGDPTGKPLTATPVSAPEHGDVTLNPDGSFTYAPDDPTSDTTDKFDYKANNGLKDSNVARVTIKVSSHPSQAPVAVDDAYTTPEDVALNVNAPGVLQNDVDSDGPSLTATLLTNPSHGTVVLASNGAFTYTPSPNFNGSDSFTYRVSDGTNSDDATVTITISSVNDAPHANDLSRTTNEEQSVSVTLSGTDTEPGTLTFNVTSNPTNGSLSGTAPNLTYTPAPNFFGTDTFTYTATDSGGKVSSTATVTITVNPVNDAPSFSCGVNVLADSTAGQASFPNWAGAISAGPGNESSQTLTFEITGNSNSALFSVQPAVSSNGTLTFTPAAGATGSASITIRLRDSGGTANGGVDVSGSCSFTISVDASPSVTTTSPTNGATGVAANANVTVNFSEPVNASGSSFTISCATSGAHTFAVSASPSATYTLNPNTDFTQGETCTVTVIANQVTDVDANDPPDTMTANYVLSFTVDAAPTVTSTSPPNGLLNRGAAIDITINFSEPVNATTASFGLGCTVSGPHTFTLSASPSATFTLNPNVDFTQGESCSVTVFAAGITDADAGDPPDNMQADYNFTFGIDAAPAVVMVSPANGATNIGISPLINIQFSEDVTLNNNSVTINCATSGAHTGTMTGNQTTWWFDPTTDFVPGEVCNATVVAAQVFDNDANDPPEHLLADYVWSFTTDNPPAVTTTTPANGSTTFPATDITVNFDESVNATTSSFTIACTSSGTHAFTLTGSPAASFTLNPTTDFTGGESCTVTVIAAQIADADAGDPPDNMAANYSFTFNVDAAPSVISTTPANGATQVAADADVVVNFSESVSATISAFDITCASSGTHGISMNVSPSTTFTLDAIGNFTQGETCTVTVFAAGITDADAFDPPDNMAANYVFSFTVDQAPSVSSTTPTNGASNIGAGTNVTVNFSESVNATGASFGINCATSGAHTFSTSSSPSASFTLDPTADFTAGETCTVTVLAAGVTDADAFDPPDNMLANYVFSFTIDDAPSVMAVTPTDTSTGIATNTNLSVTFSEPVTITNSSVTVSCANTGAHTVTVSGGPTIWTVDPTSDFGNGELCTATVLAAGVSDNDANDPPDNMLANFVWSFTTDTPPSVTATTPTNGSTSSPDTNITVTFDEAVNATASSFTISCTTSGAHTFALSGGPTTFTLDPSADFTGGETCTVTVVANQVSDQDAGDPPDNMAANYVFSFNVDAAPAVTSTTPTNGAPQVAGNTNVVINFSESVNASGASFDINCATSGAHTFSTSASPSATFTLDPTADFTQGETCTVTVFAAGVTDVDAFDPPDNMAANYVFSFTVDAAPSVSSTTPTNGATNIGGATNVTVNFDEAVNATGASFDITCATSGAHTFSTSSSPSASFTLDPTADFTAGETCTVTAFAAGITDADAFDPPDNMLANYVFSFTIDDAPSVMAVTPTDTSTGIATNTNLSVTFSEPVTITNSSVTISCANSGAHTVSVSGGPTTWTVDPTSDFTNGELCTATVLAAGVSDNDANDPPDNMLANFVWSFTTDTPPSVSSTTPAASSTTSPSANISITFDEAVNATASSFTISCTTSGAHAFALSGGPTTFTLDPTTDFTGGESCTVTVVAAQVTDQDAGDPPDNMVTDYPFTFSIDAAPTVVSTTPTNGSTNNPTDTNIVITYSEPVTASGTAYTIKCTPSNTTRPFTLSGNGTAVHTLDPTTILPAGQTCTVNILAAQISDVDANDPPDNLAADYSFSFSNDANPQIVSTSPVDTSSDNAVNRNITIVWTEPVTMTTAGISCTTSGSHTSVLSSSDDITWTINPDTDFAEGETCTVSILSASVTDDDTNDPPNNPGPDFSFQFTTDTAPTVSSTTPTDLSTQQANNTNISVTFSEPVAATTSSFTISCATSGTHTFGLSSSPSTTFTLDPDTDFTNGEVCTVTVVANQISDADAGDPPDNLAANYVFQFTVDNPPSVTATTPTNSSTTSPATNITVTFSESVNASTSSFTINCGTSGGHSYTLSASPSTTFTLNPDTDFTEGETCTVNVVAAQVTDTDAGDPPDNMTGDYSFTFNIDTAPTVVSTSPINGSTNHATNENIIITYSEPVTASGTAYTIKCTPSNTARPFVLTGNGTAVHTLDPNTILPAGQTCTVNILAAQISDVDTNDPPDNMAADYSFNFTTDANPQIVSTSPVDTSTNNATNTNIIINWTESVTMTAAGINCTVSGSHTNVITGNPGTSITINPDTDFTPGETCTITILSANVTDTDTNDPPDNPGPDFSFQFTIDNTPTVTSTTPTDLATQIANNTNITVNFSESVNATTSSFTVSCATSGVHAFGLSSSPATSFTLDPNTDFTNGEQCTVTVVGNQISDADTADPPDNMAANYVFVFTVDTPPTVLSTTPTEGSSTVSPGSTIVVNFSESVNATTSSFTIDCGGNQPFTLSASPATSFTLTPTSNLPATACTVTVIAAQITDADAGDPPDNMVTDFLLHFTVNTPPLAKDDIDNALGNLTMVVSDANGVIQDGGNDDDDGVGGNNATDGKDVDPDPGAVIKIQNPATPLTGSNGGTLNWNPSADGGYTYHSAAGVQNVDDVFTYTIVDNNGATDTGQLTIHVGPRYLFVDANFAGAPKDGRDTNPFQTLQQAQTGSAANDTFVVKQGSYTDFITLKAGQVMYGDGASAALTTTFNGKSFTILTPTGTHPALRRSTAGNTITLATNNTLKGIDVSASSGGAAIAGTSFGTLTVDQNARVGTSTTNNGTALDLDTGTVAGAGFTSVSATAPAGFGMHIINVTGTLAIAAGSISNAASGTLISGGNGVFSYGGNITHNAVAARIVDVTAKTGGSVTFSGGLSTTGGGLFVHANTGGTMSFSGNAAGTKVFNTGANTGVELLNNTGATINFPNGFLDIDTTTGIGFTATGGGTLSIGGTNSTLDTTSTATNALIINGVTVTGTATFATLNSTGATTGVSLTSLGNGNVTINGGAINGGTTGVSLSTLGTSTVTLSGVSIGNTTAPGTAITGTNFGTLSVSSVAVTGANVHLNLNTGNVNGTFSSVNGAINGNSDPITLTSVGSAGGTGNVTVSAGTVTKGGGTNHSALQVIGGNATIIWNGNLADSTAAPVVFVSTTNTGNITFGGSVTGSANDADATFDDADGTYSLNGTNTFTNGAGIEIRNGSSGTFSFSANTSVTNGLVDATDNACFRVDASSPGITYSGNLTKSGAVTGRLVDIQGQASGTITFQTGTLSATSTSANSTGIGLDNADGTVNFNGTNTLNGGNAGVDIITGSSGTFSFSSNTAITNPSGHAFTVTGSSPNITYSGTITQNTAGQRAIDISTLGGGTSTFSGAIGSSGGAGVVISGTGGTVNITGAMTLNNTGAVFNVSGTGLTIKAANASNVVGNSTAATGPGVSIVNSTIGTGGVIFQKVNVTGGTNGIVINNTGNTAGFSLTGSGAAGTGGTIQNTTSDGIKLNSTINPSINFVNLNNIAENATDASCSFVAVSAACEAGVEMLNVTNATLDDLSINLSNGVANKGMIGVAGLNVNGLSFTDSTVQNVGDADQESGVVMVGLTGTVLFEDLTVDDVQEFAMRIYQPAGTGALNATLRRVTLENNLGTFGEDGLSVRVEGGESRFLIDDCDFLNTGGSGIAAGSGPAPPTASSSSTKLYMTVKDSNWNENHQLPHAISFISQGATVAGLKLTGTNTMNGCATAANCNGAIDLDASDTSVLDAIVDNVTSSNSGNGTGLEFIVNDNATGRAAIGTTGGNTFNMQPSRAGMNFMARAVLTSGATGRLDLTLKNNNITGITSGIFGLQGMNFQSGNSTAITHNNTVCVNMATAGSAGSNSVSGSATTAYSFRQRTGTTFLLQNLTGSGANEANVESFVQTNNSGGTIGGVTDVASAGGSTIVNYAAGTCNSALTPPLP